MINSMSLPKRAASLTNQHGRISAMDIIRKVRASHPTIHPDWPRVSRLINDNYCIALVYVTQLTWSKETLEQCQTLNVLSCCISCTFCCQASTKERFKSSYCNVSKVTKVCEICFLCRSIEFCPDCHKCPSCCSRSTCRGQIAPILGNMGNTRGRLH